MLSKYWDLFYKHGLTIKFLSDRRVYCALTIQEDVYHITYSTGKDLEFRPDEAFWSEYLYPSLLGLVNTLNKYPNPYKIGDTISVNGFGGVITKSKSEKEGVRVTLVKDGIAQEFLVPRLIEITSVLPQNKLQDAFNSLGTGTISYRDVEYTKKNGQLDNIAGVDVEINPVNTACAYAGDQIVLEYDSEQQGYMISHYVKAKLVGMVFATDRLYKAVLQRLIDESESYGVAGARHIVNPNETQLAYFKAIVSLFGDKKLISNLLAEQDKQTGST